MKQNRESRQNVEVELISYSLFIQTSCEHGAATETLGPDGWWFIRKNPISTSSPLNMLWSRKKTNIKTSIKPVKVENIGVSLFVRLESHLDLLKAEVSEGQ